MRPSTARTRRCTSGCSTPCTATGTARTAARRRGSWRGRRARPASGGGDARAVAQTDLCVATLWRLSHGELGGAAQAIGRLRGRAPGDSPESLTSNTVCAALLEAKLAAASGAAGATAALDRLDSLIRSGPGGQRNGPAVAFTLSPAYVRSTVGISPVRLRGLREPGGGPPARAPGRPSGGAGGGPAATVRLPPHRLPGRAPARGGPPGRPHRRPRGSGQGLPALPGAAVGSGAGAAAGGRRGTGGAGEAGGEPHPKPPARRCAIWWSSREPLCAHLRPLPLCTPTNSEFTRSQPTTALARPSRSGLAAGSITSTSSAAWSWSSWSSTTFATISPTRASISAT